MMKFSTEDHAAAVLQDLHNQRRVSSSLCDATLMVGDQCIHAHRCLLLACSEYFRTFLTSSFDDNSNEVFTLPSENVEAVALVIDYIYTGSIEITWSNVSEILKIADYLYISKLKEYCAQVLKTHLNVENCLNVKLLAERYDLRELLDEAVQFIAPRCLEIIKKSEILDMPWDFIKDLLQETEFNYTREIDLFEMIEKWTRADYPRRKQHYNALIAELHIPYMSSYNLRTVVLPSLLVKELLNPVCLKAIEELADEGSGGSPHSKCAVVLCRTRSVVFGHPVKVLCYKISKDEWVDLQPPNVERCFDGLESMVEHAGCVYLLMSRTEDMYGYMHHTDETKHLWQLDLKTFSWKLLSAPANVHGQCRLVSHINGLFVIDKVGLIEEYDKVSGNWLPVCTPGFTDYPNTTLYVLPMPMDRLLYVMRAYTQGYSHNYAETSYALHVFDTVRHSWELRTETDAQDIDLADKERFHGYIARPGSVTLKNDLGQPRVDIDLTTGIWARREVSRPLPRFVLDIWGCAELMEKVFMVGRTAHDLPQLLVYDRVRQRVKVTAAPPDFLSGLMCQVTVPNDMFERMTNTAA